MNPNLHAHHTALAAECDDYATIAAVNESLLRNRHDPRAISFRLEAEGWREQAAMHRRYADTYSEELTQ